MLFSKTSQHLRCNLLFGLIGHFGLLQGINISFFLSFSLHYILYFISAWILDLSILRTVFGPLMCVSVKAWRFHGSLRLPMDNKKLSSSSSPSCTPRHALVIRYTLQGFLIQFLTILRPLASFPSITVPINLKGRPYEFFTSLLTH